MPARARSVFETRSDALDSYSHLSVDSLACLYVKLLNTDLPDSFEDMTVLLEVVLKKELDVVLYIC